MMPHGEAGASGAQHRRAGARALVLLPIAAGAALAAAVARFPVYTPDVWWHLATGRLVAATGIPRTDPFSWTLGDRPWMVHEWLADLVLHAANAAGGLAGVVALRTLLLVLAAALAYRLARLHASTLVALPLVALAGFASERNWLDRPQLWSYALAPLVVWLLERDRMRASRLAFLLPAVFVLWVNLHGGFMLGLGIVALWTAARWLEPEAVPGLPHRRRRWIGLALCCAVATLLNPNGLRGALYPLRYVGSGLSETIQEEQPGRLDGPEAWVHFGLSIALAVSLLSTRPRGRPLPHVVVGLALVWLSMPRFGGLHLPLAAERHAPLFLFAATPILAWRIETLPAARGREALLRVESVLARLPASIAAAALAAFAIWHGVREMGSGGGADARLVPGRFPAAGARWLESHPLPPRLLNPYRWGGYLAYRLAPRYKVWIDSRGDLYGPERLRQDELLYRMPPGSESAVAALVAGADPDVVVWYFLTIDFGPLRVHPLSRWLLSRSDWRLVWYDRADPSRPQDPWATTAIFLRVHERNADLLRTLPAVPPPAGLPR
jgi:hypothetical protein